MKNADIFYRKSIISSLATKISIAARSKMVNIFLSEFHPSRNLKILDLGATSEIDESANYLEQIYPFLENITCAGIQDCSLLLDKYPGIKAITLIPGQKLPFDDNEFDIVYSNAVIEHVGSRESQANFLAEAIRVSKAYFITTPNRWFPVEHHTHLPLLHYLPQPIFRFILSTLGESLYSKEENLNLCSSNDLVNLFPVSLPPKIQKIYTYGFVSNLVAYGRK
jgi:hypothetical protein